MIWFTYYKGTKPTVWGKVKTKLEESEHFSSFLCLYGDECPINRVEATNWFSYTLEKIMFRLGIPRWKGDRTRQRNKEWYEFRKQIELNKTRPRRKAKPRKTSENNN